jgi:hypothetical protein
LGGTPCKAHQRSSFLCFRDGFELAEARYEELRPVLDELERLEKEQQAEEEELAKAALKAKDKKKVPSRR